MTYRKPTTPMAILWGTWATTAQKHLGTVLKTACMVLCVVGNAIGTHAQNYPVGATLQLLPPHSPILSEYSIPGTDKLRLTLILRDLREPTYDVRLRLLIEGPGIRIETNPYYNPPTITLESGFPLVLTGTDLAGLLAPRNLEFSGLSRQQFGRSGGVLPEGVYRFSISVYDQLRPTVALARPATAQAWLALGEPPLLSLPGCGTAVTINPGQQNILFQWTPLGASPYMGNAHYKFSLFEVRPASRDINDAINTSPSIYTVETDFNTLVYGPAEPPLVPGTTYAWRVQVVDEAGLQRFKNQGYSQACGFTVVETPAPAYPVGGLEVLETSHDAALLAWEPLAGAEAYRVEYRKSGDNRYRWHPVAVDDPAKARLVVDRLEPETGYEARIAATRNGVAGPFGKKAQWLTIPYRAVECHDEPTTPNVPTVTDPLPTAMVGDVFTMNGFGCEITQVTGGDGVFSGECLWLIPALRISLQSRFEGLRVNTLKEVVGGEIVAITDGYFGNTGDGNEGGDHDADDNPGSDKDGQGHAGQTVEIDKPVDSVYYDHDKGVVVIIDQDGGQKEITPEKDDEGDNEPVAVVDSNGDKWLVDKNGNVKKVPANVAGDGNNNGGTLPLPELEKALIMAVLGDLERDLQTWLSANGKGPLDEAELAQLMAMPDYVPKDPDMVEGILAYLRKAKQNPALLAEKLDKGEMQTIKNLARGLDAQKPIKPQLAKGPWRDAKATIGEATVREGLLYWFGSLTYPQKSAKVLKTHWERSGAFQGVYYHRGNIAAITAVYELPGGGSITQTVDFATVPENDIFRN